MIRRGFIILSVIYLNSGIFFQLKAQPNTVGTIFLEKEEVFDGYTLLYPENQNVAYLIDHCGQWVHKWVGQESQGPGKEVYLLEDGRLLRTNTQGGVYENTFGTGGAGGVIELLSWDNENLWTYIAADSTIRQHHDVELLPNGNVLMIVWEKKNYQDVIDSGFDTLSNNQVELWPDKIIEVDPSNDSIVWEWSTWDHLVQEYDDSKKNFGSVADYPELIDLNYQDFTFQRQDIHHINAIDYNPEFDQILLSIRNFNELWIIDHSTTTEEAASHSGGIWGKGGDLLWRWGNPASYKMGNADDQKLFRQHFSNWVDLDILNGELSHSISVYNNFIDFDLSLGQLITPKLVDTGYVLEETFLPENFSATYSHPDTIKNFSTAGSSIQLLENGNVMICAARQGRIFEINGSGDLVWEYLTPLRNGFSINQGEILNLSDNFTFSARKYPSNYPAFEGKDLTPKGFIELNPSENCLLTSVTRISDQLSVFPNPSHNYIEIQSDQRFEVKILDIMGQEKMKVQIKIGSSIVDLSNLNSGFYLMVFQDASSIKLIKN